MTRHFSGVFVAVAVAFASPATGFAQSVKASVAIVPVAGKGGPKLDAQVKVLETALKSQVGIVPLKAFKTTAKKLKVKPKEMVTVSGATTVAKELKLTHVVLAEGSTEKIGDGKKKKAVSSAKITIIAIETGETIFTQSYVLKGKKLTKDVAEQIAGEILPKLAPPPPPATPTPVAESEAAPPAPPAPPPAAPEPPATAAAEPPPAPAEATPAATEATPPAEATAPAPAEAAAATPPVEAVPAPEPVVDGGRSAKARPALIVRVGALGFQRKGLISDSSGATDPLRYDPPSGFGGMAAGLLQLELYPLALKGRGAWYEGIGIDGEGTFTQVGTEVQPSPGTKKTVTSPVYSGRGGLSWRIVLWNSETAADIKVRAGYGMMKFPLDSQSSFPGTSFAGPYAGLTADIPILRSVALVLGGTYTPSVTIAGDATKTGASLKSASSFLAEGGLRLTFAPIEIGLVGRYEQYSAKYSGDSTFTGLRQYRDASFSDKYTGGMLTAGMQL